MLFVAISILAMPILAGYAYGRNHVNPDTEEGKIYYASKDKSA